MGVVVPIPTTFGIQHLCEDGSGKIQAEDGSKDISEKVLEKTLWKVWWAGLHL